MSLSISCPVSRTVPSSACWALSTRRGHTASAPKWYVQPKLQVPPDNTSRRGSPCSAQTIASPWQWYCSSLEQNPAATKAVTSLVGFMLGDILAQRLEGIDVLNVARTLHLGMYGLMLDGPVGHMWYKWLDGTCDKTFDDPKGTAAVAVKTTADQIIWAPIMTCVFFAFLKLLEGHPEMMLPEIQDKVLPTVAANYVIWPAAHVISFKYVPSHQRILYNNVIAIFWNCYLSTVASGGAVDPAVLAGIDVNSSVALYDMTQGLPDLSELLDLNNPIGQTAAQLAAKQGSSSPFIESVMQLQSMVIELQARAGQ